MKKTIVVLVVVCAFIIGWYSSESKSNNNDEPIENIELVADNPNEETDKETDKETDEENTVKNQQDSDKEQKVNKTEKTDKLSKTNKRISICYECAEDKEIEYEFGDGRGLCISCFNICSMCQSTIKGNEGHILKGYAKVCNNCYENIVYCDSCGTIINAKYQTIYKDSDGKYCETCHDNRNTPIVSYYCKYCDVPVYSSEDHYLHLGSTLCEECYNMAIYIEDDLGGD